MTGSPDTTPQGRVRPRLSYGVVARTVLRVLGSVAALGVAYYLLPLDHASAPAVVAILIAGLTIFVILLILQVRVILRSPFPGLRGVEALAIGVPFFLLLFASAYVATSSLSAGSFSAPLSHADSLYFTVTVFSTVGFGDIVATSKIARMVVTGQMMADLIVLGVAVKVIVGAVQHGRYRRAPSDPGSGPGPVQN